MIWLTWRQFRAQAIAAVTAIALFTILLALTESQMSGMYDSSGLLSCHAGGCVNDADSFLVNLSSGTGVPGLPNGANGYVIIYFLSIVVILVAPAVVGSFWGAPLIARELESGTSRLVWNQSVTRTRWLAVKLALIGAAAMIVTEAFSLIQAWWAAPIGKAIGLGGGASIFTEGRFGPFVFPTHGITPLGYAAFGFAVGVTIGTLVRRPIPAMAATLAVFAAAQLVSPLWIRPHLLPTSQTVTSIQAAQVSTHVSGADYTLTATAAIVPGSPDAWILSSGYVTSAGQPVSTVPAACVSTLPVQHPGPVSGPVPTGGIYGALQNCLASHGTRVTEAYQPVSHYWPLHAAETAMFLILALLLAWYCYWRLTTRRS